MREQTALIQKEIGMLVGDVMRLDKRVDNLGKHFELAQRDVQEIKTSTGKISNRGRRIEDYDVATEEVKPVVAAQKDLLSAANEKASEIE